MKSFHRVILTVLLILPSIFCFAQNASDTARVNFIKTQYTEVNKKMKSYKEVVKTDTAETTEGDEIRLYFNGDEIKNITAIYYGENGKRLDEYYFFNKKLMFCYFVEYKYDMPINANGGKVKIASKREKRYYFKDDKIFLIKLQPNANGIKTNMNTLTINTQKEAQRLIDLK